MYIGVLEVRVRIDQAFNLKEKRQVIKSVFDKVKRKYDFSPGEVEDQDVVNLSGWGFACVSNSYSYTEKRLEKLENFLENDLRFEILEIRREIINDIR